MNNHLISYQTGSTAAVAIIIGNRIYTANAGDSWVVISCEGWAINLTKDHNLEREDEKCWFVLPGAIDQGWVRGRLEITWGFGDADLKGIEKKEDKENISKWIAYVDFTVQPEIKEYQINPFKDEFLIVASDGLFKSMKS